MIKIFEMFSGYGGACFGLKRANIPFECVGYSEINKYAIQCYQQNHCKKVEYPDDDGIPFEVLEPHNYGDCTKIKTEDLPDFDLLTGGFPCQDVSIAGNRDLSKGRTNLYQEIIRIASVKKPKFLLLENVKGLLSIDVNERSLVNIIVSDLQKIGYGVIWKVLNSKDYGVPQNRERIWFVCKLGGWNFMEFTFPEKEELKIKLKDLLEKEIDEKYYLNEKQINSFLKINEKNKEKGNGFIFNPLNIDVKNYSKSITTKSGQRADDNFILIQFHNEKEIREYGNLAPTLIPRTIKQNLIVLNEKTRDVKRAIETAKQISNKNDKPVQLDIYHLKHGEIRPLSTYIPQNLDEFRCLQSGEPKEVLVYKDRIRKLTPKECFRLMGFFNDEINLDGLSDNQCYKLAGNGWDVNLVSKIFKRMFK